MIIEEREDLLQWIKNVLRQIITPFLLLFGSDITNTARKCVVLYLFESISDRVEGE